ARGVIPVARAIEVEGLTGGAHRPPEASELLVVRLAEVHGLAEIPDRRQVVEGQIDAEVDECVVDQSAGPEGVVAGGSTGADIGEGPLLQRSLAGQGQVGVAWPGVRAR